MIADTPLPSTESLAADLGRALLESELVAVISVDDDDRITGWGIGAERLFGYPRSAAVGHEIAELIVPEETREARRGAMAAWRREASSGERYYEQIAVRSDGSRLPVAMTVIDAGTSGFIALVRDITERRAAEEQLARNEERLAEAEAATLTGSFDRDLRSGRGTWSAGMHRVFGLRPGGALPDRSQMLELLHPDDREQARAELRGAIERRSPDFTFHWRLPADEDGERLIAVRGKVLLDDRGDPIRLTGTVRDVTEEWRATRAREFLAYVVESSDDAIITKRLDGTITSWNAGAERLYGYTAAEAIGRSVAMLCPEHAREEQREMTRRVFAGESISHVEAERVGKDGRPLWVSLTLSPVRDPSGRILSAAVLARDVTERRHLEQRLRHLADHDTLTGLFNRRRFEGELRREIARVERHGGSAAILSLDLDSFKQINDLHGHAAGDALLRAVARTLQHALRASDVAARYGGDEFAVLLPETTIADAQTVGEHLLSALHEAEVDVDGLTIGVSASVGGVSFTGAELDVDELLIGADQAMYAAKQRGRDGVVMFSRDEAQRARAGTQAGWTREIRDALEDDRLVLHFQPIVAVADGAVKSGELLLRMRQGDALVEAGAFLGTAQRLGLIREIDRWVVRQAVRVLASGRAADGLPLSINIAADSMSEESGLLEFLAEELHRAAVEPWRLRFEVTEAAAAAEPEHARYFATGLRDVGCALGLDNFGSGVGSFLHLQHLPIDFIKIDHRFIRRLPINSSEQRLVRAMADVAHGLCIASVATGVDAPETIELLRDAGVDYAQGFHVGAPRPL